MSSPNKVYSYLLRNYGEDVYLDITAYVGEKARGGEELNQLPESIKFTVDDPEDLNGDRVDIGSDSEIVICKDNSYTEVIGVGIVEDPGRQLLSWDWINDRPIYRYNLSIEQKDFSSDPIDAVSYTDTLLSDILDDLFLYSDDSLGGIDLDKYYLNIPDFTVKAFTFEKGTLREAITALCKQLRLKWVVTDYVQPDSTNLIATKRTIDFFDASGLQPIGQNSSWSEGINDDCVKFGTILNPYDPLADEMPGDYDFEPAEDRTVIINHLEVEANIYTGNDTATLHRWTEEAKPNTVVYNLDGIAAEVVYVGFLIQSYCLDGSTDTIIRIPSKHSPTIAAGNIARVINAVDDITDTIEEFIEVDSVNVVNTDYTEITLTQALSFTPAENYIFEIVGNVTIVDDNQETYASTGVAIELSKGQDARLRFLDLSEPPPGVTIICYYKKVQPYRIIAKHGDSKLKYGTKYKYKKLDDDVVTTREELQNIANSALIPYPNYILNFKSSRPEKLRVGTSLPVNVATFEDKNYICTKATWEDLGGLDENRDPAIRQEITLMTVVENTDSILNNFEQAKKTTVTSEKKDLFYQNEQIKLLDNMTWSKSVYVPVFLDLDTNSNTKFYLTFQDGSGTNLNDETSNNNDFTVFNSNYTWLSPYFSGDSTALYIDNNPITNGNYASLADNSSVDVTGAFTFECIMSFKSWRGSAPLYNCICTKYQTSDGLNGTNGQSWLIAYNNSTTKLYMQFFNSASTDAVPQYILFEVTTSLSLNTIYYFQFSYNPTTQAYNINVDGVDQTVSVTAVGTTLAGFGTIKNSAAPVFLANLKAGSIASPNNAPADVEIYRAALHAEYHNSTNAYDNAHRFGFI